jgi:ClpP class serine protease
VVRGYTDDNEFAIASSNAPKKAPDMTTEEGKAVVREELDALHDLFVDAIAEGRSTDVDKVNAEFGQGATLLAEEAFKRGMIDKVADTPLTVVSTTDSTTTARSGGNNPEKGPMDLNTLKAQHPDVYAAAVQEGVDQEHDRVSAHLTMGEASGDMKTAVGAINDGSAMTAKLQAQYMAAGMNRADVNARQDDDNNADAGDGANAEDDDTAKANAAAGILEAAANACGVEVEA